MENYDKQNLTTVELLSNLTHVAGTLIRSISAPGLSQIPPQTNLKMTVFNASQMGTTVPMFTIPEPIQSEFFTSETIDWMYQQFVCAVLGFCGGFIAHKLRPHRQWALKAPLALINAAFIVALMLYTDVNYMCPYVSYCHPKAWVLSVFFVLVIALYVVLAHILRQRMWAVVVLEESVKSLVGLTMPLFEYLVNLAYYDVDRSVWPFLFHVFICGFPWWMRVLGHLFYNEILCPRYDLMMAMLNPLTREMESQLLGKKKSNFGDFPEYRTTSSPKILYPYAARWPRDSFIAAAEYHHWPDYMVERWDKDYDAFQARAKSAVNQPVHEEKIKVIPKFSDGDSFESLEEWADEMSLETFVRACTIRGWNPEEAKLYHSKVNPPKAPKRVPAVPKAREANYAALVERPTGKGVSEHFRVLGTPRSAPYRELYMARKSLYADKLRLEKHINVKTKHVCANEAAIAIWIGVPQQKELARLFPKASLYVHDFSQHVTPLPVSSTGATPQELRAHHCLFDKKGRFISPEEAFKETTRTLFIGNREFRAAKELDIFDPVVKKQGNKMTLRLLKDYLNMRDVGPDGQLLNIKTLTSSLVNLTVKNGSTHLLEAATLQGGVLSTVASPVEVHHTVDFQLNSKPVDSMAEIASEVVEHVLPPEKLRLALSIAAALYQMYSAPNATMRFAALVQFVTGNDYVWATLRDRVLAFAVRQADDPSSEEEKSMWSFVFESGLAIFAKDLGAGLAEALQAFSQELAANFRISFMRELGQKAASTVIEALTEVFRRLKSCIQTKSFSPLWGPNWDPLLWERRSKALVLNAAACVSQDASGAIRRKELVASGDFSPLWLHSVDSAEFCLRLNEQINLGRSMLRVYARDDVLGGVLRRRIAEMEAYLNTDEARKVGAAPRQEPFFFVLHGPPGSGKTRLSLEMLQAIADREGFSQDPGAIYNWQTKVNFQTGLDHNAWAIRMDDIDQSTGQTTDALPNHAEVIIKAVNTAPWPIEEADVERKGRTYACPRVIPYTTNFENLRLTGKTAEPGAVWRRVKLFATIRAKPEYANALGSLDPDKARAAATLDLYDIDVRFYQPPTAGQPVSDLTPMLTPPMRVSLSEFMRIFYERYDRHARDNREYIERVMAREKLRCSTCHLDITHFPCGCPVELEEKDPEPPIRLLGPIDPPTAELQGRFRMCENYADKVKSWAAVQSFQAYCLLPLAVQEWQMRQTVHNFHNRIFTGTALAAVSIAVVGLLVARKAAERCFQQGREHNASGIAPPGWVRADQNYTAGISPLRNATWTLDDIKVAAKSAIVPIHGFAACHGVILTHNTMLVPKHAVWKAGHSVCDLKVTVDGRDETMVVPAELVKTASTSSELALISYPNTRGRTMLPYIPLTTCTSIRQFDDLIVTNGDWIKQGGRAKKANHQEFGEVIQCEADTQSGDCGAIYIGKFNDKWWVVGLHIAIMKMYMGASVAIGCELTRDRVTPLAESLGTKLQALEILATNVAKNPEKITFSHFPPKSEYWAAQSQVEYRIGTPVGTISEPRGQTMKTGLRMSLLAPHVADIVERWGATGLWHMPNFRGRMNEQGFWESPYTDALLYKVESKIDPIVAYIALMDYLCGMDELDFTGFDHISEVEAVLGIPGSVIQAMDLSTSFGPPYGGPKSKHMMRTLEGEVFFSDTTDRMLLEIEDILAREAVPVPVGKWTLKDEPIKTGKKPRTFIVFPAAFNMKAKQDLAVIQAIMRAFPDFFECAVGINMSSAEATHEIRMLFKIGEHAILIELDGRKMDLSIKEFHWELSGMIDYSIAHVAGLDKHRVRVWTIAQKHTLYEVKGDFFFKPRNPSGGPSTVYENSKNISVGDRYAWYARRRDCEPTFSECAATVVSRWLADFLNNPIPRRDVFDFDYRKNNSLRTYGDDLLKATIAGLDPNYARYMREEWGIVMTDAQKTDNIVPKKIEEVTFLKRNFVWDEELGRYLTPLDKRSLARTLLFKKDSTLSDSDYAAVSITEVLREIALHGEEEYEFIRERLLQVAEVVGVASNPNLRAPPYEKYRDLMREGTFAGWERPTAVVPELSEPLILQGKMTEPEKFVNAADMPATRDATVAPLNVNHPVGVITDPSPAILDPIAPSGHPSYQLPTGPLGSFLERSVEIGTGVLSNGDTPLTFVHEWDPWVEFFINPYIAAKAQQYKYFRGTLEVTITFAVPANCYGMYAVTALCNGGYATHSAQVLTAINHDLAAENCLQTDHCALLDCAASTDMVFTLPFVYPFDYAEILTPDDIWKMYITCLAPVRTSVPDGVATGHYRVFARVLNPELTIPIPQGKVKRDGGKSKAGGILDTVKNLQSSKIISKTADSLGKAALALAPIPFIGEMAMGATGVLESVSYVASMFGFTREGAETRPQPIVFRSFSNVAHLDNEDTSEWASLSVGQGISIDPRLCDGDGADCTAFASVFSRWTLISRFTWTPSASPNTILTTLPVTPFYGTVRDGVYHMTTAGFCGLPFLYWRGDMEYRICVPVSKMHRGTLQVLWFPDANPGGADSLTTTTFNVIHEIAAGEHLDLTIGYASSRPAKEVDTMFNGGVWNQLYANGTIAFRVINPLMSQNQAADVDVIVFARACPNMEFSVPRSTVRQPDISHIQWPIVTSTKLQGATGDEEGEEFAKHAVVPASGIYPTSEMCFGERIGSCRALMQKPSLLYHSVTAANSIRQIPHLGPLPLGSHGNQSTAPFSGFTYAGWYRTLFLSVAGSERVKTLSPVDDAPPEIRDLICVIQPYLEESLVSGLPHVSSLAPLQLPGPNGGLEVTIPYYTPKKFSYGFAEYHLSGGRARGSIVYPTTSRVAVYWSMGADLRVAHFRQVPGWTVGPVTHTTRVWPHFNVELVA